MRARLEARSLGAYACLLAIYLFCNFGRRMTNFFYRDLVKEGPAQAKTVPHLGIALGLALWQIAPRLFPRLVPIAGHGRGRQQLRQMLAATAHAADRPARRRHDACRLGAR